MKKIMIVMAIALSFMACKKDSVVAEEEVPSIATTGKYLKKVNYWMVNENKEATIRELVLNASGDVTALKTYNTSGKVLTEYTAFQKDVNGKVTSVTGEDKSTGAALVWTFSYTGAGNLSQALISKNGVAFESTYREYDSSNRLTLERLYDQVGKKTISETTFVYTGTNLNPTSKTTGTVTTTFKFDDKKNPSLAAPTFLYALGLVDFYKSNILESVEGTFTNKWTLTYNADGYVSSATNGSGAGLKYVYGN